MTLATAAFAVAAVPPSLSAAPTPPGPPRVVGSVLSAEQAAAITTAVEAAIRARLSDQATVTVTDISGVRMVTTPPRLVAIPEPAARIGAPMRFRFLDGQGSETRPRVGEATVVVEASTLAVRAKSPISRGSTVSEGVLQIDRVDLAGRLLRSLPTLEQAIGARAMRDIAAGAVLTGSDVTPAPDVRAGEPVRVIVRVEAVEIAAELTALDNGIRDATIRVINDDSRRVLRARVRGKGEAEVINVR